MNNYRLLIFIVLFVLLPATGCNNMQPVHTDIYATETALHKTVTDTVPITQTQMSVSPISTPTVQPVTEITDEMYLTAVASMAPPQPTPTPFPTLEFMPTGKIAYLSEDNILHVIDGNGENAEQTVLQIAGSKPVWSPNGETIVFSCTNPEGLCFLDAAYLGNNDPGTSIRKVKIPQDKQPQGYVSSYSWSPDGEELVVMLDNLHYHQLCVLTYDTLKMDCNSSNHILSGFSNDDIETFRLATSAIWSPVDADLMVISVPFVGKLYLVDLSHKTMQEIKTPIPLVDLGRSIAWSPDGKYIAFSFSEIRQASDRICQNYACLYSPVPVLGTINVDGTNYKRVLDGADVFYRLPFEDVQNLFPPISTTNTYYQFQYPSWSPDGRFLLFVTEISPYQRMVYTKAFRIDLQTGYFIQLKNETSSNSINNIPSWAP